MTALSQPQPTPSTFASRFGVVGLAGAVRSLSRTLTDAVPRHHSILSLRADVMQGKMKPVEHVLKLMLVAVDLGRPVDEVTLWLRDCEQYVRAYAARRASRASGGVLSFEDAHRRHVTRSIREDAEADVATATVDMDSIASLQAARAERLEAIRADEVLVSCYTERIAQLIAEGR